MFNINQGFSLKSAQFNFERDYFESKAALDNAPLSDFPDKFITIVGGESDYAGLWQLTKSGNTGTWNRILSVSDSSSIQSLIGDLGNLATAVGKKVDAVSGKGLSTNDYTTAEKNKLANLSNYTHPASAAGAKTSGLYKIATDANGHVSAATAVTKSDIMALGIPAQDTDTHWRSGLYLGKSAEAMGESTEMLLNGQVYLNLVENGVTRNSHLIKGYDPVRVTTDGKGGIYIGVANATIDTNGLMINTDKEKLDKIASNATADSAIDTSDITTLLTTYFG